MSAQPQHSAEILPFPTRSPTATATQAPSENPTQRLQSALAALDAAVLKQRAAVTTWQAAIGDLRTTMSGLGTSLHTYRGAIGTLGDRVECLGDVARRIQAETHKL